ncbi:MAG: energy transducer TonB [Pyrinomonadaceae bacterium]
MGKIVKYCTSCEESFSERFSFCPNCAQELTAFEMKPVEPEVAEVSVPTEQINEDVIATAKDADVEKTMQQAFGESIDDDDDDDDDVLDLGTETEADIFVSGKDEGIVFEAENSNGEDLFAEEFSVADDAKFEEPKVEQTKKFERQESVKLKPIANVNDGQAEEITVVNKKAGEKKNAEKKNWVYIGDPINKPISVPLKGNVGHDVFEVTVIPEEGRSLRRSLLLGAGGLVLMALIGGVVWSIFNNPYFVASIGDNDFLPPPIEITPTKIEDQPEEKKEANNKGGGGGGGGTEREVEASRGQLPSQTRDRIPPIMPVEMMKNPSLVVRNQTVGDIKRERTERIGLPNGLEGSLSGGTGSGGGFGSGDGTGVGSGRGRGEGSGVGSGSGSGIGDGTGDGTGVGGRPRTARTPSPPKASGPTADIKILAKPRPGYTDTARQNNVQGTVILRVTFQANGSIGSISAVKGLPYGLTEKAIAAAREIRFTPATRNGQPYPVSKQVQYSFTIY